MRRFFHAAEPTADGVIVLVGAEAHHAAQVIRIREGESAIILDGRGREHFCEASSVGRRELRMQVERTVFHQPPACRIRLFQAITKGKSFEIILQKAVELGASEIVPVITDRVVARPASGEFTDKRDKWQQVVIEALKQCGAFWLPTVWLPTPFATGLAGDEETELRMVAALAPGALHPRPIIETFIREQGRLPTSASVWIGPEGDFSDEELGQLTTAGVRPVTLGSHVLRSETAALWALAVMGYELSAPR